MPNVVGVSSPVAAAVAGLSLRQVTYWSSTRLLSPSVRDTTGKGVHRRYSLADVRALAILGALRRERVSAQGLRRAGEYLRAHENTMLQAAAGKLVLTRGERPEVYFARTPSELVALLVRPGQTALPIVIDLAEVTRGLEARITKAEREREKKRRAKKKGRS